MDGKKAAELGNRLLDCCYDAELNRFELLTAFGLVADRLFEDVPEELFNGWVSTLRRRLGLPDA